MMVLDEILLKAIARQVRDAIRIERTPRQIERWALSNLQYPEKTLRECLKHPSMLENIAKLMRIDYLEKSPPSSDWYESP